MSERIEVQVPDIGDFKDVPVIEILVRPGDAVAAEQPLITLESDKATMDVPSPAAGTVREILVAVGDRISQGSPIASIEPAAGARPAPPTTAEADAAAAPAPSQPASAAAAPAGSFAGKVDAECGILVLGAGPGGYSAAFRAADLGLDTIIVERYAQLGGVCLNVGCIPSKTLLHAASIIEEAGHAGALGIGFSAPQIDLDRLREHKAGVVGKLTGGLAAMARARKVRTIRGVGRFVDAHHLEVDVTDGDGQHRTGEKRIVRFRQCIVAAGSQAVRLPFLPEDPRIVDSTGALALPFVPDRMLVIGGGIIGLEMATVYSALGAKVDVVEMLDGLMQGPDRDLVKVWEKQNRHRFDKIMLGTRTASVEAKADGLWVGFEGAQAPAEPLRYDLILQSAGRRPNGGEIGAENAGLTVDERGFIAVDRQMRTNVPHIFAIGDIVGQPMLAHKAVHEAHVAAEAAAGLKSHFDAMVIPGVAYTHPEIAWAGVGEDEAKRNGLQVSCGKFPWAASGRAIANGAEYGFTKLVFDAQTERVIGGGIVGPHAGDLIGEVALAIELGATAVDIGKTIHPHPTLGESVGMAAEVAHGTCTDLPPARKAAPK